MNSKRSARQTKSLSEFLTNVTNSITFSSFIFPLIQIDKTSKNNLQQICDDTIQDDSQQGKQLNLKANRLLSFFKQFDLVFNGLDQMKKCKQTSHQKQKKKAEKKIQKIPIKSIKPSQQLQYRSFQPNVNYNDQNINLSNFQLEPVPKKKINTKQENKQININLELKQIVRPQYRRQIGLQSQRTQSTKIQNKPNKQMQANKYEFISSQEQQDYTPPIIYTKNKNKQMHCRNLIPVGSQRSVSPKVENSRRISKHQINSISEISRNIQTGSDVSFQIDLNSMGIFSQNNPTQNIQTEVNHLRNNYHRNQQGKLQQPHRKQEFRAPINKSQHRDKTNSDQIREEQPWECDEEQIQEQIRQINERLSHRAYQTHRIKTQCENNQLEVQNIQTQYVSPRIKHNEGKKSQIKTVRLSLTPSKKKLQPHNNKVEIRHIEIMKNQPKRNENIKLNQKNRKYERKQQEYLIQKEKDKHKLKQFQCSKWSKPKKGVIEVDIQSYVYER